VPGPDRRQTDGTDGHLLHRRKHPPTCRSCRCRPGQRELADATLVMSGANNHQQQQQQQQQQAIRL